MTSLAVLAALLAATFVVLSGLLYLRQDEMMFFPGPNDSSLRGVLREQHVAIPSGDIVVEGWWLTQPQATTARTIVYFGGNAEDVLHFAAAARELDARHVLVTNYRGFGGTPGRLSQKTAYQDGLAIYDFAAAQPGVAAHDIVVMGRSLGSGVATYVAAHRPVGGAILVTAYDSIAGVAAHHYPMFPVRWLVRHPFPSDKFAARATAPALFLAAELDNVIPPIHAQRLFDAWGGPRQIRVMSRVGHNDIEMHPDYYPLIAEFLQRRASGSQPVQLNRH